ncbi:MAG: mechanosensitive ion channel family protein [Chloroflexota bacterium]|nr:MAG: mechanosensitive ion channel family protein [Chloroflexota bacterium]HDD61867.1 mechanosensitive ion channel family protein [Chloroflexota bacterium]
MGILEREIIENSVQSWLIAVGISLGTILVLLFIKRILKRRLENLIKKSKSPLDDYLLPLLSQTRWFSILAGGLLVGLFALDLPEDIHTWSVRIIQIIFALQVGFWGTGMISLYIERRVDSKIQEDNAEDATTLDALGLIVKIALWSVLALIILDNLNVEVSSLVASLGIGGIAVALAAQNILGDLFASLSITLDKPFVIGDFVMVDDFEGDVEDIGLKSTRIRSLSGEELIFSNTDLLNSRIRNYKRLEKRRISFNIGVIYGTPVEKLKKIPGMIENIISPLEHAEFDRTHFKTLSDFSLDFSVVYHVLDPAYSVYLDIQQTINLEIYQQFEKEGIEFAYPTQTVIVESEE